MRSKFIPQMTFGSVPIVEIEFDVFCRHELVPILMALKHLYVNRPRVIDEICALIREDITRQSSPKIGCGGLTYWEILVLSALRLGSNLDYDQLSDLATWHRNIRQIMGISDWDSKRFPKSTIHDNLSSLSDETIERISGLIVDEGHRLRPKAVKRVRADSYVVKKNIHYPTDANLLLDGIRNALVPPRVRRLSEALASELQYFLGATEYMADLAVRRVIAQEHIPHEDKVFSIFEPDTELINRGKAPQPIEFGHRVLIVEDSAGFIVHARVMEQGQTDEKIPVGLMRALQKRFNGKIEAASFDKGFWSPANFEELRSIVPLAVLPKKGKRAASDADREGTKEFGRMRKWHAGVEAAIAALQAGNGLCICRDKGVDGYRRYLALGVLGRNLQVLGTIFLEKERKRRRKERFMMAA